MLAGVFFPAGAGPLHPQGHQGLAGGIAGLLGMEAAGIEPAARRKQNPKQVALLPANALISHRIVPPLRPVSSRFVPFNSPLEGHTGGTCDFVPVPPEGQSRPTQACENCLAGTAEAPGSGQ